VYVLKLVGGNYYIGRTRNDVGARFIAHLSGKGSEWTKRFKPVGMPFVNFDAPPFEETRLTLEYMNKYGRDKVRGSIYSQISLDIDAMSQLDNEWMNEFDICYKCGKTGHISSKCKSRKRKLISPMHTDVEKNRMVINGGKGLSFHRQISLKKFNKKMLYVLDGVVMMSDKRKCEQISINGERLLRFVVSEDNKLSSSEVPFPIEDTRTLVESIEVILKNAVEKTTCPTCASKLLLRNKNKNKFWGCSTYSVRSKKGCMTKIYIPQISEKATRTIN